MGQILSFLRVVTNRPVTPSTSEFDQAASAFVEMIERYTAAQQGEMSLHIETLDWMAKYTWRDRDKTGRRAMILTVYEAVESACREAPLAGFPAVMRQAFGVAPGDYIRSGQDYVKEACHVDRTFITDRVYKLHTDVQDTLRAQGQEAALKKLNVGRSHLKLWLGPADSRVDIEVQQIKITLGIDTETLSVGAGTLEDPDDEWRDEDTYDVPRSANICEPSRHGHSTPSNSLKSALAQPGLPPSAAAKIRILWDSEDPSDRLWINNVARIPFGCSRQAMATIETEGQSGSSFKSRQNNSRSFPPQIFEQLNREQRVEKLESLRRILDDRHIESKPVCEALGKLVQSYNRIVPSNPQAKDGRVLALVGPPGVGKTTLLLDVFHEVLNRPTVVISVDGPSGGERLGGTARVYRSAQCGRIAQGLIDTKRMDCTFFFDEIDKVTKNPAHEGHGLLQVLNQILDPTRNTQFVDQYFGSEVPLDLSQACFAFSANSLDVLDEVDGLASRIGRPIYFERPSKKTAITILRTKMIPDFYSVREIDPHGVWCTDSFLGKFFDHHKERYEDGALRSLKTEIDDLLNAVDIELDHNDIHLPIALDAPPKSAFSAQSAVLYTICRAKSERRREIYEFLRDNPHDSRFPAHETDGLAAWFPDFSN